MTFTDISSQRTKSHSLELFHNEIHNNDHGLHQNPKLKKPFHMSFFDLLHWHRPIDTLANTNIQQQQTCPHRPSIIKSSDISRAISKKSVTFASSASVFDLPDNDNMNSDLETNITDETTLRKDCVIIIGHKQTDDESTIDPIETIEPYPSNSPIDIAATTSYSSRKNIIDHFIHHRHPKKHSHPIQNIDPIVTMYRSNSAPNILLSSAPPTAILTRNDQEQPSKTISAWFKSSSLGRFVKSFGKKPRQNQKNLHINLQDCRDYLNLFINSKLTYFDFN